MPGEPLRMLILGAHPDDAEFHAGGLATLYRQQAHDVKMISVTDGGAGHHERAPEELRQLRRREAAAAGKVIGATYDVWKYPDGALQPTLELRRDVIREIRVYRPDLVLTHRLNDYHPDHRAVGQAVQDASFMVTVPHVVPEVPALRKDPVVAYMPDLFTKPNPLTPDIVIDISSHLSTIVDMLACHTSQVFEWLPYLQNKLKDVPTDEAGRKRFLREWYCAVIRPRADRYREKLEEIYGAHRGATMEYIEAYEISEYAARLDDKQRARLFGQLTA